MQSVSSESCFLSFVYVSAVGTLHGLCQVNKKPELRGNKEPGQWADILQQEFMSWHHLAWMELAKQSEYNNQNTWAVLRAEAHGTPTDHYEGQRQPILESCSEQTTWDFHRTLIRRKWRVKQPELESPSYPFPAVWPWESYLTTQSPFCRVALRAFDKSICNR